MHAAATVLQKCLSSVTDSMHAFRVSALLMAVQCLLSCRRLVLMDLARACPGEERVRAPLKRLDRLLSNRHLAEEREAFYAQMMRWLICHPNPLILIDWSDLHGDCRWQLLRAAIPLQGRAFTVLEMVFPESMKGSPRAQQQFLHRLRALLPAQVRPILVTDAGFCAPWLRLVTKFGWYYVGRLRGRTCLCIGEGSWLPNKQLHSQICGAARRIEDAQIGKRMPWRLDLVLYRKPGRQRVCVSVRTGRESRANTSLKAQRRESEPWILVTSPQLRHLSAAQIVSIYSKRMQIEQSFRDLKCHRFGCAFAHSLTRDPKRIAILLLIHALATFAAWLAALSITAAARVQYGAVMSQSRLLYSRLRIGWEALRRNDAECTSHALHATFNHPPQEFHTWLEVPA